MIEVGLVLSTQHKTPHHCSSKLFTWGLLIQCVSGNGNDPTWLDLFESSGKGQTSANKSDNSVSSFVKTKLRADT